MRIGLAALAATALLAPALSHESAITRGSHRNASGEGCCELRDCAIVQNFPTEAEVGACIEGMANEVKVVNMIYYWCVRYRIAAT